MNPQTRNNLIVLAVVAVIGLIVGGGFLIWWLDHTMKLSPFQSHLQEYLAQPKQNTEGPGATAYIKGKIITVESNKRELDWLYFDLPAELKAKNHEEVGTVVWLNWGEEQIDSYTNGASAMVHLCRVTVIDQASHQSVAQQNFRGGEPPEETKSYGKVYGSKPTKEIVSYLQGLPRR